METQKCEIFPKSSKLTKLNSVRTPSFCMPRKKNRPGFVNISPTLVIDTSTERSSRVLQHGNQKIWFFFSKKFGIEFDLYFDLCWRAEIIQVGLNMHLYVDIGDASSSLWGSTSSSLFFSYPVNLFTRKHAWLSSSSNRGEPLFSYAHWAFLEFTRFVIARLGMAVTIAGVCGVLYIYLFYIYYICNGIDLLIYYICNGIDLIICLFVGYCETPAIPPAIIIPSLQYSHGNTLRQINLLLRTAIS